MALVRAALGEGRLTKEAKWQVLVPVPKGRGNYRGIVLVEVVWKVVVDILYRRLTASITYKNFLYGFLAGCGTVIATLKAKLIQQLAAMKGDVLYVIFLDLNKEYEALDRDR